MLSIYLALSIEGWAEKKSEHKKLRQYYENMVKEIVRDTISLTDALKEAEKHVTNVEAHLQLLRKYETTNDDTITKLYQGMLTSVLFNSSSMLSYQSMVLSGDIKLIENLEVREKLIDLEENYKGLKIWEDIYLDFFQNDIMESFSRNFDLLNMSRLEKDYYSQTPFRNLVVKYYSFNSSLVTQYKSALKKARETYAVLQKELEE